MFFDNLKNHKSNTIIKSISVVSETIPLYIIINGQRRMDNWFNDQLNLKTIINISDTRYTNN